MCIRDRAYAVGGCVRDTMLHRTPGDWDITTQAKPEQVKEIFAEKNIHTIDTGKMCIRDSIRGEEFLSDREKG